jgi:tartrate-resistant acid phosphatase type 5
MNRSAKYLVNGVVLCLSVLLLATCIGGVEQVMQPDAPTLPIYQSPVAPSSPYLETSTPQASLVLPTLRPTATTSPTDTALPAASPTPDAIRFAVIGDYGEGSQGEQDVADLVKSWNPDFVITTGDNNYPSGSAETIDAHIGAYYHEYISPYNGAYGQGAERSRFFPTLGNHDWDTARAQAYFDYFSLPGNERYYDFTWGPVHFFALDSDSREPDGVSMISDQALWLQAKLAEASETWKLVYMHHPPYSSGPRGPVDWMRWPFKEWGASAVLSGHDHYYERLMVDGLPYLINGLSGGPIYDFGLIAEGSLVRFNGDYGAMLVVADSDQMTFQFITRRGEIIDSYQIGR